MKKGPIIIALTCLFAIACKDKKDKPADQSSPYIQHLKEQANSNPDSLGLRLTLIDALDSMGLYKEALPEIDQLITKDSLNHGLWITKGKVQQNTGDTVGAILSFHRAARIYPSPEPLLALANLYAETKDSRVFEVCAKVDELKMGRELDSYTTFFTGVYYARMGDKQKAIALFDKSINYNYTLMDNYIEKGSLYYEDKKYDEAIKVFKVAAAINNTYADAYYWQGKCFEAMNDKPSAITNYNRALVLDKNLKEAEQALKRLK